MRLDYHIQPNTKRCASTGRELRAGEQVYTVLMDEAGHWVRRDYSVEAWQGPPPQAFSFWTGRVANQETPQRPTIDDELLMDCFHRLEGQWEPHKISFRYVVALLLMRRKRVKFENVRTREGSEIMVVSCARTKKKFEVVNPHLSDDEILAVQDEVFKLLGWE